MAASEDTKTEDPIRPFEWLTSATSMRRYIAKALSVDRGEGSSERRHRVLHVGSGSSTLGEHILEDPLYNVCHVLNVDKDSETLNDMQLRWQKNRREQESFVDSSDEALTNALHFQCVDFCKQSIDARDRSFDLVADKSTLDCTLCSDRTTARLLLEVYRLLRPSGGVYLLVSFHDKALLQPLLENLPGADWTVEHHVMQREVESLIPKGDESPETEPICGTSMGDSLDRPEPTTAAWSSGSFEPDDHYRRTVNVFLCRKKGSSLSLDPEKVYEHVNATSNKWYRSENPMLTSQRVSSLQTLFAERLLELREAYEVLFTDAEREHLAFDYFVEDWHAFLEVRPELPKHELSFETAIAFLDEMQ